jgi:hypothetical protein
MRLVPTCRQATTLLHFHRPQRLSYILNLHLINLHLLNLCLL